VQNVAAGSGVSRPSVWCWQQRFVEDGVAGLLRDKTHKLGKTPLPPAVIAKILALLCGQPPRAATHGTGRMVAKAADFGLSAVQRIGAAHRLQPHRVRTFGKSNDPAFATKEEDNAGLPMNPRAQAAVVSIDETSPIQAPDRIQPRLPPKPGRCGTMNRDCKRHGTTTLFATLNILDRTVVGRCMSGHTLQEFIKFLAALERAVPAGEIIHAIADDYATCKHPKVRAWFADLARRVFHFTPTSAFRINAVDGFFPVNTELRIRRGMFTFVADLQDAISSYIH
jgi:hypothetical protein